ncbi:diguanylate cyclase [Nonomuraea coxensis]
MNRRELLWDKESLLLDIVELCLGISVAILCGLNLALLLLALPPVVLLQRSLLHAQLQAAARTDAKTGLLNAAAWQREADMEIVRARRTNDALALLIIDIDHFKRVNDAHGHLAGDQVLIGVASTLRSQLREYDVVGRFGGEEFVVLLPGADTHEARRVAERLRARIRHLAVPVEDSLIRVTISIGVALLSVHGDDLIELLAAADLALYRAKELGRDRVCVSAIQPQSEPPPATHPQPDPHPLPDPHHSHLQPHPHPEIPPQSPPLTQPQSQTQPQHTPTSAPEHEPQPSAPAQPQAQPSASAQPQKRPQREAQPQSQSRPQPSVQPEPSASVSAQPQAQPSASAHPQDPLQPQDPPQVQDPAQPQAQPPATPQPQAQVRPLPEPEA